MKKIISIITLACFALLLPVGLFGCSKKKNVSLEGTWTFKEIEFVYYDKRSDDTNVFTNDKNVNLDDLFGRYKQASFSFNNDGTCIWNNEEKDFVWEEVTLDTADIFGYFGKEINNGTYIKITTDNDKDTEVFFFENGKLSLLTESKFDDYEKDINNIFVKIVFEKK